MSYFLKIVELYNLLRNTYSIVTLKREEWGQ